MKQVAFFRRKQCLVPTAWGWSACIAILLGLILAGVLNIQSFLSPINPKKAEVLVVEGWLPDYALESAVHEFKTHRYRLCVATGGPLEIGNYLSEYKSFADVAALTLRKLGIDSSQVVAVRAPFVNKDRTYASSAALREWLDKSGISSSSFNVFSLGCHSRRSHLIFSRALGHACTVGIIACKDRSYDNRRWWHYSSGLRIVVGEAMVYVYALLFAVP
jgi:hypothetical protein